MRYLLYLWLVPVVLLGVWYGLSSNDIHFGTRIFSRELHDLVLKVYADTLGVEVHELPTMLMRALVFDVVVIGAIIAIRKRAVLIPFIRQFFGQGTAAIGPDSPAK